jgi:sec-independent protein translocase protein TatA
MFTDLLTPTHLMLVAIVALVFLGPKRLPDAGRALGQGLREFKSSIAGGQENLELPAKTAPAPDENPVPR